MEKNDVVNQVLAALPKGTPVSSALSEMRVTKIEPRGYRGKRDEYANRFQITVRRFQRESYQRDFVFRTKADGSFDASAVATAIVGQLERQAEYRDRVRRQNDMKESNANLANRLREQYSAVSGDSYVSSYVNSRFTTAGIEPSNAREGVVKITLGVMSLNEEQAAVLIEAVRKIKELA